VAEKLGIAVEFVNGFSWTELVEMFQQGKLDVLPCIYKTEERQKTMAFTKKFAGNPSVLIVKTSSTDIFDLADLDGHKIAAIEGYATTTALEKRHPGIKRILVKDALEGLQKVSLGEVDAFIETFGVVSYLMQKNFILDIKIIGDPKLKTLMESEIHMAVLKDREILRDILQKGLNAITADELQEIRTRWMPISMSFTEKKIEGKRSKVSLSPTEQAWLNAHPVIRVHNEWNWPPFNYNKDGKPTGLSIDYMNLLASRIGIKVKYIPGEWGELLDQALNKKLDVMLNIAIKSLMSCSTSPKRPKGRRTYRSPLPM